MKYIYGPVKSRRLGLSLGISLTPFKICSFDCIYCQLGTVGAATTQRKEYANKEDILFELKSWFKENTVLAKKLHCVSLSGFGEPTLNTKFGELIPEIKKITSAQIVVITNSAHLSDPQVRKGLLGADLIIPSLDAADEENFLKVDRPAKGIKIEDIIDGLVKLRNEFSGRIWLEIMLVAGVNDSPGHIVKLREAAIKIKPDKIQLNSPVRQTALPGVLALERKKLEEIKEFFGSNAEIV